MREELKCGRVGQVSLPRHDGGDVEEDPVTRHDVHLRDLSVLVGGGGIAWGTPGDKPGDSGSPCAYVVCDAPRCRCRRG